MVIFKVFFFQSVKSSECGLPKNAFILHSQPVANSALSYFVDFVYFLEVTHDIRSRSVKSRLSKSQSLCQTETKELLGGMEEVSALSSKVILPHAMQIEELFTHSPHHVFACHYPWVPGYIIATNPTSSIVAQNDGLLAPIASCGGRGNGSGGNASYFFGMKNTGFTNAICSSFFRNNNF